MRKVAVASLAIAVLALIALLIELRSWKPAGATAVDVAQPTQSAHATADVATDAADARFAAREVAPAESALHEAEIAVPSESALALVPRTADLDVREWITFRVENEHGYAVAGAAIDLNGLRTVRERGSHYSWRGDPSLGVTDANGVLKLAYPVWVNLDDETGEISLTVTHPDYATFEDTGIAVAPEIRIVLKPGSVLVISGWIGERTNVITDVRVHFSWDVDVAPEDWLPRRDGVLTTTRVPPGTHIVFLEHASEKLGVCYSALTEFTLDAGETEELHLELKPALKLVGRLDEAVPRPVIDGRVELTVQMRSTADGSRAKVMHSNSASVNPDGTFAIERLMRGDAQIVALCKGWASKQEEFVVMQPAEDGRAATIETELSLQRVELSADAQEFVVAMEPTATLEVELVGPDGAPAANVTVHVSPNACWLAGACGMFVNDRDWSATSDARGLARIDDIPAGSHSFGVAHAELDLPRHPPDSPHARRTREAQFASGDTWRQKLTLERKTGD